MANITSQEHDCLTRGPANAERPGLWQRLRAMLGIKNGDATLRESIEDIIEGDENAAQELRDEERHMLINILNFAELRVEDVMVPRADIIGVEVQTAIEELASVFRDAAHSRLPVYRENLDDPIGMVHIKDVIGFLTGSDKSFKNDGAAANMLITKLQREILFVPPSMPIRDLFLKMQATRIHMGLVIDEYGGTDGLVTIEDLVEEIVGEIEDEHDTEGSPGLTRRFDGGFDADARVKIEDLEQALGMDLIPDEDEDVDTLGGLLFSLVGRVPQRGELIPHSRGLTFEVVDADPRRVKKLRILPISHETPDPTFEGIGKSFPTAKG
jgi:CBS domain containing-hemolysin-like protein